ncbi:MAG: prepilin-type N-terminal cleavage/methylation domain-containing protein [Phycisphaerae bacterium]
MRSTRAFTLVEMLAVVSIMLILLGVSYGILNSLAQQAGPEAVLVTVQAMVHNARDYAAGRGVHARVEFRFTEPGTNDQMPSSTMRLQYWTEEFGTGEWVDVPGRDPVALPQGLYVCKGFPSALPQLSLSVPDDAADVTDQQVQAWQSYEQDVLDAVKSHALGSGTSAELKDDHDEFYIVYGPEGYPVDTSRLTTMEMQTNEVVGGSGTGGAPGLTLVRLSGTQVSAYTFYLWNQNTGTRLIFQ